MISARLVLCGSLLSSILNAATRDIPGATKIESIYLTDGALTLAEIGGSISAPSREWEWYRLPSTKASIRQYICVHPSEHPLIVALDRSDVDIKKMTLGALRGGVLDSAASNSSTVISEHGELLSLPPHDSVYFTRFVLKTPVGETTTEQYYLANGEYLIACLGFVSSEPEKQRLRQFATGLRYKLVSSDKKSLPLMCFYFVAGAIAFWAVRLLNHAFKRPVAVAPKWALFVVSLLVGLKMIGAQETSHTPAAYHFGLGLLPLFTFGLMWWQERRSQRGSSLLSN